MDQGLNKHLIATFADMTEALAARSALETEGIPCEVGDLAQVPSPYLLGMGSLGRSVGIWVLQVDAERAGAVIAELRENGAVDEAALAAEAMAAGAEPGSAAPAPARPTPVPITGSSRFSPAAQVLAVVTLLAIAFGLLAAVRF